MKIAVIAKADRARTELLDPHWLHAASLGHDVWAGDPQVQTPPWTPDAVVGMSVTLMEETFAGFRRWPNAKRYCYNWDVYEFVWTNPRKEEREGTPGRLDYARYGKLLEMADEVWTPSDCTTRRTKQWYPWVTNVRRILSSAPTWEYENVHDGGYALCCLREIPDPWWGVFERCCGDLGIPFKSTRHECSEAEYRDAVAGCRFICAPLYELSTGGLSLLEAYYHGKPVLLSDSEWNGGQDYFGDRASYFRHGDEDDFKLWLTAMMKTRPEHAIHRDHKEWVTTHFSPERMTNDILIRIEANL